MFIWCKMKSSVRRKFKMFSITSKQKLVYLNNCKNMHATGWINSFLMPLIAMVRPVDWEMLLQIHPNRQYSLFFMIYISCRVVQLFYIRVNWHNSAVAQIGYYPPVWIFLKWNLSQRVRRCLKCTWKLQNYIRVMWSNVYLMQNEIIRKKKV